MSPSDKNKVMKSTIKIDYERSKNLTPVIKIIIPKPDSLIGETTGYFETIDEDVKDGLIRSFLHSPCMAVPNSFFEVKTHYPIHGDLELTTIGAISEDNLFSRFRWALIHRFVPTSSIAQLAALKDQKGDGVRKAEQGEDKWHRINEFFDWLDKQAYAPTEEEYNGKY